MRKPNVTCENRWNQKVTCYITSIDSFSHVELITDFVILVLQISLFSQFGFQTKKLKNLTFIQ